MPEGPCRGVVDPVTEGQGGIGCQDGEKKSIGRCGHLTFAVDLEVPDRLTCGQVFGADPKIGFSDQVMHFVGEVPCVSTTSCGSYQESSTT